MHVLLVAYDIHTRDDSKKESEAADARRDAVKAFIERYSHRRLSESAYAVEVPEPALTFTEEVLRMIRKGDEVYIIPLVPFPHPSPPFFGDGPESVQTWLEQRLLPRV
ncbi:hypothetical protein [Sorangium sp. So ce1389]|uniref:hypothetical protein n=1 Tax=Sorangium sp. So ce1389 TaxID=3133336 RepID=UPI003F5F13E4